MKTWTRVGLTVVLFPGVAVLCGVFHLPITASTLIGMVAGGSAVLLWVNKIMDSI